MYILSFAGLVGYAILLCIIYYLLAFTASSLESVWYTGSVLIIIALSLWFITSLLVEFDIITDPDPEHKYTYSYYGST